MPSQVVAVHDGPFHADDVLAAALFRVLYPSSELVRSRDPEALASASWRVDVGGKSDPSTGDFDHHFVGSPARADGTVYAACGLVWDHFGEALMGRLGSSSPFEDAVLVDERIWREMDMCDTGQGRPSGLCYDASTAIAMENVTWLEAAQLSSPERALRDDELFRFAMGLSGNLLVLALVRVAADKSVGEKEEALDDLLVALVARGRERAAVHAAAVTAARSVILEAAHMPSRVLTLHSIGLPWQGLVHWAEAEAGRTFDFVVEPTSSGTWMATSVPQESRGTVSRRPFPGSWAGLRGSDLAFRSGLVDAVFCHPGRWISGWGSEVTALAACSIAAS